MRGDWLSLIARHSYRIAKATVGFGFASVAGFYGYRLLSRLGRARSEEGAESAALPPFLQSYLKSEMVKVFRSEAVRAEAVEVLERIFRDERVLARVVAVLATAIKSTEATDVLRQSGHWLLQDVFNDVRFREEALKLLGRLRDDPASGLFVAEFLSQLSVDEDVRQSVRDITDRLLFDERAQGLLEEYATQVLRSLMLDEEVEDVIQAFTVKFYEEIRGDVHTGGRSPFERSLFIELPKEE